MAVTEQAMQGVLYRDHAGWLRAWLLRRLGCRHTAADLAQDTFVRLLLKSEPATPREPRAYLATIAHGLVVDHHRRRAIERTWLESIAALSPEEAPSPETRATVLECLARIDALLDGLKPRVRRAFLLSRLDGLSHPRIAETLGVSLSTVEKDMATALRHCYRALLVA